MSFGCIVLVKKLNAPNSQAVQIVVADVVSYAQTSNIPVFVYGDDPWEKIVKAIGNLPTPIVIAIGGDGTVITAAKLAWELGAPVLGFNLGKVGFLADFCPKSVRQTLDAALTNKLVQECRGTIKFKSDQALGISCVAVNDIVISCENSDTSLQYDLLVGNAFAGTHTANGVIFSTPTGSTAYALAVGGSIIMPSMQEVMQIVPVAAQTLSSRPLIVPSYPGATIKFLVTKDRPVTVRVDGIIAAKFSNPEEAPNYVSVEVEKHHNAIRLLHHDNWNHFKALTEKLGWNK